MRIRLLTLCFVILVSGQLLAETLDRVVASIGNAAVTQSEIESELRLERFMDGQPQLTSPDAQELEEARDRLIKQNLLALEAEEEGVDKSGLAAGAAQLLEKIREMYPDQESYQSALSSTRLSQEQILERLARHVHTLRLIDQRVRPNAWVEQPEIEAYYKQKFVPAHTQRNGTPPPPLEEVESQIREILLEQKVDQLLGEWLKEIASRREVRLHSF